MGECNLNADQRLIDISSESLFASSLTASQIQDTMLTVQRGLSRAERYQIFLRKVARAEEEFAAKIEKITKEELAYSELNPDEMLLAHEQWGRLVKSIQLAGRKSNLHSKEIVRDICNPFLQYVQKEKSSFHDLESSFKSSYKSMLSLVRDVENRKQKYSRAILEAQNGERGIFRKPTDWEKLLQYSKDYEEVIGFTNQFLQTYHDVQIPQYFLSLQRMEHKRLEKAQDIMLLFADLAEKSYKDLKPLILEFIESHKHMDPETDLQRYIRYARPHISQEKVIKFFMYDLPMSVKDIEAKTESDKDWVVRILPIDLSASPEAIVLEQKKLFAELNLSLPRIFLSFKRAIEDLGGLITEGIFRISATSMNVEKLLEEVYGGNYDFECTDPHVVANALKKWLREMKEPLLSPTLRDQAFLAVDIADKEPEMAELKILSIFNGLSTSTQLLIKGLIRLMRDISHPPNREITKMTPQNLAVVFAPSFARVDNVTDPIMALQLSEKIQKLIVILIRIIETSDYPTAQEELARSSKVTPIEDIGFWKRAPSRLKGSIHDIQELKANSEADEDCKLVESEESPCPDEFTDIKNEGQISLRSIEDLTDQWNETSFRSRLGKVKINDEAISAKNPAQLETDPRTSDEIPSPPDFASLSSPELDRISESSSSFQAEEVHLIYPDESLDARETSGHKKSILHTSSSKRRDTTSSESTYSVESEPENPPSPDMRRRPSDKQQLNYYNKPDVKLSKTLNVRPIGSPKRMGPHFLSNSPPTIPQKPLVHHELSRPDPMKGRCPRCHKRLLNDSRCLNCGISKESLQKE